MCRSDDEDESEAPVLEQAWQINPHDIFFCSKSDGKLCKLGKGAFGTVSCRMPHRKICANVVSRLPRDVFLYDSELPHCPFRIACTNALAKIFHGNPAILSSSRNQQNVMNSAETEPILLSEKK